MKKTLLILGVVIVGIVGLAYWKAGSVLDSDTLATVNLPNRLKFGFNELIGYELFKLQ